MPRSTAARFETPILSLARNAALARARIHHAVGEHDAALALLDARARRRVRTRRQRVEAGRDPGTRRRDPPRRRAGRRGACGDGRARGAGDTHRLARVPGAGAAGPRPGRRGRRRGPGLPRAWPRPSRGRSSGPMPCWCSASSTTSRPATSPTAYRAFDSFGAAPWRRRAAAGLRARGLTVPRRRRPGDLRADRDRGPARPARARRPVEPADRCGDAATAARRSRSTCPGSTPRPAARPGSSSSAPSTRVRSRSVAPTPRTGSASRSDGRRSHRRLGRGPAPAGPHGLSGGSALAANSRAISGNQSPAPGSIIPHSGSTVSPAGPRPRVHSPSDSPGVLTHR